VTRVLVQVQVWGLPSRLWQRDYPERIIRADELDRVRRCICDNPARWLTDRENPARARPKAR
jgi:hypothetical protein